MFLIKKNKNLCKFIFSTNIEVRGYCQISTFKINLKDIISSHRCNHWAFCNCLLQSKSRSVPYIKVSFSIKQNIFLSICTCMYVYIDIYIFLDVITFSLWKFIVLHCCNTPMGKYMFKVSNRTLPHGRKLFRS